LKKLIDQDDKEISEINMTPFVDIILVVLIIFMATATFIVEGKIPISLPEAKTGEKSKHLERKIVITIKADGTYYLNGNKVNLSEIKEQLKKLKTDKSFVILRSDKNTTFQNFVSIIDICRDVGIEQYMIETKKD
jgi:biopolymer transport protein ExbD